MGCILFLALTQGALRRLAFLAALAGAFGGYLLLAAWLCAFLLWAPEPSSARRPREILSAEAWRLALEKRG